MAAATENTPLNVPFKEKDEVKSHGARWNPGGKHWYIPEGVEADPFEKWLAGAPAADTMAAPSQTPQTTSSPKQPTDLPANADFDDINAMLRDAYEPNE
jgi:hypothetical protein